jgi:hypothetical protein
MLIAIVGIWIRLLAAAQAPVRRCTGGMDKNLPFLHRIATKKMI